MRFRWFVIILDDLLLLAGMASLVYGAFQVYSPAGYGVLGINLIILAYLVARRRESR